MDRPERPTLPANAGVEMPAPPPPPEPVTARIHPGPRGMLFWARVRDTWLANRALDKAAPHVKCGLGWDAKAYLPLVTLDERGVPLVSFHRP